ncbi:MAG TPA: hypothetical protein VFI94_12875 [Pseudolabrys sp.]|nr:hypothetical protein [Pseudolabrys sp.]
MKAFLASKAVDQISDYSQRGRSYRALSGEQLNESWQAVWNELAADPTNIKTRDVPAAGLRVCSPTTGAAREISAKAD